MKQHAIAFLVFGGVAACTASPYALAADTALRDCAREKDDAARLACYDRHLETPGKPAEPGAAAGSKDSDRGEPVRRQDLDTPAVDNFGMTGELARRTQPVEEVPESIDAVITRIVEQPHGERIVYLDNGQVWKEIARTRSLTLKVNDQVTVEAAALGSYRLIGPGGKRSTRANRIR